MGAAHPVETALTPDILHNRIAELALDRKALDVVTIDIRERASYADYLVIASGTSDRHVQAIAQNIEGALQKEGLRCMGREGLREGQWALMDYGHVVLHVFHQFTREVFAIEQLYDGACEAKRTAELTQPKARALR